MASIPLLHETRDESHPRTSTDSSGQRHSGSETARTSSSTASSTTSAILNHISSNTHRHKKAEDDHQPYSDGPALHHDEFQSLELGDDGNDPYYSGKDVSSRWKRWCWIAGALCVAGWLAALGLFLSQGAYRHRSEFAHDPSATASVGTGKKITLEQVQNGSWQPTSHGISWIDGPHGEDGMILEQTMDPNVDFLTVKDVRRLSNDAAALATITLMKSYLLNTEYGTVAVSDFWPSPDLKTVLVASDKVSNWRHSFTAIYWLFDVETQMVYPLDPAKPRDRVQLATWSPTSDAVVFTRENNMFLRKVDRQALASTAVTQITKEGGEQVFNGVPDWVYEEEVISGRVATWWSSDGKYVAFLEANDTEVPEFPIEYFFHRPSNTAPPPGLEDYPEVRQIKYPKAGTPNPTVRVRFYDVQRDQVFDVAVEDDFPANDKIINEVIWAGDTGHVILRVSNRESYHLKVQLLDVKSRTGRVVREQNFQELDGGWLEISESTRFVPKDPRNGRPDDGYIDTVIHEGHNHMAYFAPLNSSEPKLLTKGKWEVSAAPSAVDLTHNYVYFVSTKDGPTQRHVYKVDLDGSNLTSISDTSRDGFYAVSFSKKASYALLSYNGPDIPWQKVVSTPSLGSGYEHLIEDNADMAKLASQYELPLNVYSTVNVAGYELNVIERRPPHFHKSKKYPVLFQQYSGPGSQSVQKKWAVDFQSYVAAALGYIVVTVDGRGTGFMGRRQRCAVYKNLGYYESYDQIETAKIWGQKAYVDEKRMAIWGWSYGGYTTLKTLEQDAGRTFQFGMAVAPVTDWAYYDSIYTERWMMTPQHNPSGYANATVSNVTALASNTRFLVMHGTSDDNVHVQNTLALLDQLDLAQIENYDVHFFPDSDHGIYFHSANRIVYDKLAWWLTNAFNGEWDKIEHVKPIREGATLGSGEKA